MKKILCHGCMEPYELNSLQTIQCPNCQVFQYCSNSCLIDDWRYGGHSYHCSFVKNWKGNLQVDDDKTSLIQIKCGDELFHEYEIERDDAIKATGKQVQCSMGDQGRIVRLPTDFDSAGSFLIKINDTVVLCDVSAMENASPISKYNSCLEIQKKSNELWNEGIWLWNEKKDFLHAMILFEQSLDYFQWNTISMNDDDDDKNSNYICDYEDQFSNENVSPYLLKAMYQPSTINKPELRTCLAKR